MDKDERNHWIMGYMSDKGYGMDSASARRNLQNILNRDRKGKDVLGDLMNIMGEMIKEDEQSVDREVLIQDLNEYTEMCDELKDDLLKVEFERDGYKTEYKQMKKVHDIHKSKYQSMMKQNAWLKQWARTQLVAQNGNDRKLRCEFSEAFSDKEWDMI